MECTWKEKISPGLGGCGDPGHNLAGVQMRLPPKDFIGQIAGTDLEAHTLHGGGLWQPGGLKSASGPPVAFSDRFVGRRMCVLCAVVLAVAFLAGVSS